ncbi:hypothetical protein HDU76_012284 [Blyttiomyces sp. JEL0837]|nr:hypothetical protein HDU76_012284 [Blyttiomyces sp. JEL0837]
MSSNVANNLPAFGTFPTAATSEHQPQQRPPMNNGFTFTFTGLNLPTEQQTARARFGVAPFQQSNPLGIDVGNMVSTNNRGPNTTVNRTRVLKVEREAEQLRKQVTDLEAQNSVKDKKISDLSDEKFRLLQLNRTQSQQLIDRKIEITKLTGKLDYTTDQLQIASEHIRTRENTFSTFSDYLAIGFGGSYGSFKFQQLRITYYAPRLAICDVDSNISRGAQSYEGRFVIRCFDLSSLEFLLVNNITREPTHRADSKMEPLESFFLDNDAKGPCEQIGSTTITVRVPELHVVEDKHDNIQRNDIVSNYGPDSNKIFIYISPSQPQISC